MSDINSLNCEHTSWPEIKSKISAINPSLAKAMNACNLGNKKYFILAKYQYGESLSNGENFNLPLKGGGVTPITEVKNFEKLDLHYNQNTHPTLIVMSKCIDCYVDLYDRIIPFVLCQAGDMLGVSVVMLPLSDENKIHTGFTIYDIKAGARTVCMAPKISQAHKHKRLRRQYPITTDAPKHYIDHFHVFRDIGKTTNWECETLFCKHELFQDMHKYNWHELRMYLYECAYNTLRFWASSFPWELSFTRIAVKRDIKKTSIATNFMKHIFALSSGSAIGMEPAIDDSLLPCKAIQEAYINNYQIEHPPTIMQPAYLTDKPIYASIHFPLLDATPTIESLPSTVSYLDDIRFNFERSVGALNSDTIGLKWSPISNSVRDKKVEFFHTYCGDYPDIQNTSQLVNDNRFITKSFDFCGNLPLFNGLIKVSPQSDT